MPFDTLAMAAVADEVRAGLAGGRIQKIIQPSAASVALSVYNRGARGWLLLSADARYARVHLSSDRLAKAFPTPSSFVMLLRKHLDGAFLQEIRQVRNERILHLHCGDGEQEARLVAEIMGKHSNVLLLDGGERVLGALKIIPPHQSRVRPVLPGQPYEPPPRQARDAALYGSGERVDPLLEPDLVLELLSAAPAGTPLRAALLGLLAGISPFLAEQIAARAGYPPSAAVEGLPAQSVLDAASALYALRDSGAWRPCTFHNARGALDFAPYMPVGMENVQAVESISAAIERCLGENESRDVLGNARKALLAEVERADRSLERRLASLQEALDASGEAEQVMQQGQLLLAYQYAAEPGSSRLDIPELEMSIPLDPFLSASENAERLFRRYRKLRDAQSKIPGLMEETEAEMARLQDLATFVRLADSEGALRALRADFEGKERHSRGGKKEGRKGAGGPARYRRDGQVALVGRNARENEEVTFRLARRDDLWLHARQRTGAHVILSRDAPDETVNAAAQLAAHFSEGRSDTRVDVDVTEARNVRKIPGGPPGRVTYQNFRTVRVTPSLEGWSPDRS